MLSWLKSKVNTDSQFVYLNNNASTLSPKCFANYLRDHRCYSTLEDYYNNMVREDKDGIISRFKKELLGRCGITCGRGGVNDSPYKVIITSSASESNNMLLKGFVYKFRGVNSAGRVAATRLPNVLIGATEHKTSIYCVNELEELNYANIIKVKPNLDTGIITMAEVYKAVQGAGKTIGEIDMVSLMTINNETGIITNISQIFAELKAANPAIFCHTDIVQSFGKCAVNLGGRGCNIDAISISFHKLYGPIGCGAVIIRCSMLSRISPLIHGNQNCGMRGGTESVYLVELSRLGMDYNFEGRARKNAHITSLYNLFCEINSPNMISYFKYKRDPSLISKENYIYYVIFGDRDNTLCNTLMMCIAIVDNKKSLENAQCIDGAVVVSELDKRGIVISRGAMCSGDKESYVLEAHGIPKNLSRGGFRVSLGDINTDDDIYALSDALSDIISNRVQFR